jgi:hypothetical protein
MPQRFLTKKRSIATLVLGLILCASASTTLAQNVLFEERFDNGLGQFAPYGAAGAFARG